MSVTLNQGQEAAADAFFSFLFSTDKEMIISGEGGTGKSFLISYLIDKIMPRYHEACRLMNMPIEYEQVAMTATTNKAAEVLAVGTKRPTSTIHSFLNLLVKTDYETGATRLKPKNTWKVHEKVILFIDECSMVDAALRQAIHEGTNNSKIVYVGDHCQLAPVTETISPIYRDNLPFVELTEQMRTGVQPLRDVNAQLRHTVETGEFFPIPIIPGYIDWLDDDQMQAEIDEYFFNQEHPNRILAYTNKRVNEFNDHIRGLRQLPDSYTVGEKLVSNSAVRHGKQMLSVEENLEVVSMSAKTEKVFIDEGVDLEICRMTLENDYGAQYEGVRVPVDRSHFDALVRYYTRKKDWKTKFFLTESFPDLRPRDASTVHKSQGSTYDTSYIDLDNISTCHNADQVARMLYVAFSRARHRVVLYGNLAEKYGGIAH